jgi:hypothetical protein
VPLHPWPIIAPRRGLTGAPTTTILIFRSFSPQDALPIAVDDIRSLNRFINLIHAAVKADLATRSCSDLTVVALIRADLAVAALIGSDGATLWS